ncbi:hypothetical protein HMPREF2983_12205 [Prevotella sp. HMSC077E09]|nr:hypothetical protein HMPREF3018_07750 [Prevotella sp. HMSC077E08]OFP50577.1 hypothetical protein HMPREF2983_12205 [Prevotella sp. HMSC077E09]
MFNYIFANITKLIHTEVGESDYFTFFACKPFILSFHGCIWKAFHTVFDHHSFHIIYVMFFRRLIVSERFGIYQ